VISQVKNIPILYINNFFLPLQEFFNNVKLEKSSTLFPLPPPKKSVSNMEFDEK